MAKILFVHNGASSRFGFLGTALNALGHQCAILNGPDGLDLPDMPAKRWKLRGRPSQNIYRPAIRAEIDFLRGRAAAEAAREFQAEGFEPDLIIGHPGWGEMLFLREVFPNARQIHVGEFFYRSHGADVNFDPEFGQLDFDGQVNIHAKNAGLALSYAEADWIVCPTPFQASVISRGLQSRVRIIHEGVDTALAQRVPDASIRFSSGLTLGIHDQVVTFINRRFEPMRGFHVFMRSMPQFLALAPEAHVLIVGADDPNVYGMRAPNNSTWKKILLEEVGSRLDFSRLHFIGSLDYMNLIRVLSLSSAHVYFTYPFVLSWSLLDAMSSECLVVGSDTAPVRDAIRHGENGLLTDFFNQPALAEVLASACKEPERYQHLRQAARRSAIEEFDRATICEPAWLDLVNEALN